MKRQIFFIILSIIIGVIFKSNVQGIQDYSVLKSKTVGQPLSEAKNYQEKNEFDLEEKSYRDALEKEPYNCCVLRKLNNLLGKMGKKDSVIEERFSNVFKTYEDKNKRSIFRIPSVLESITPELVRSNLLAFAELAEKEKNYEKAEKLYRDLLVNSPYDSEILDKLNNLLQRLEKKDLDIEKKLEESYEVMKEYGKVSQQKKGLINLCCESEK